MAVFSSKTKLKPCYDNSPNLRVKKELGKLKPSCQRGYQYIIIGNTHKKSTCCQQVDFLCLCIFTNTISLI